MQEVTKIPIDFKYRLESKHFILEANYVEVELRVKLVYNKSGTTYQRVFTNEDIGRGSIHPKEDLIDIFCTLIPSQYIKMLEQEKYDLPYDKLEDKYGLGDFIERQDRGFTVYEKGVILIKTKNKGPKKPLLVSEWYESKLVLELSRKLDLESFLEKRLGCFKRELIEELQKINQVGDPSKIEALNNISDEGVAKNRYPLESIQTELQLLREEVRLQREVNPLQIDFRSPFANKFTFKNNVMTYNGDNNIWTQILRIKSLSKSSVSSFTIKIQKLVNSIIIGVVDRAIQSDKRISTNTTNAVALQSNGSIFPQNKGVGCQYKAGDTIEVKVDPKEGMISWKINNATTVNYQIRTNFLTDKARQIVPYAEFYSVGDSIRWITEYA